MRTAWSTTAKMLRSAHPNYISAHFLYPNDSRSRKGKKSSKSLLLIQESASLHQSRSSTSKSLQKFRSTKMRVPAQSCTILLFTTTRSTTTASSGTATSKTKKLWPKFRTSLLKI